MVQLRTVLPPVKVSEKTTFLYGNSLKIQQQKREPPPLIYHAFTSLSYDRSKASSKASSPHSAI